MPKEQPGWVKSSTTKNQLETVWRDPKEIIMYAKNSKLHPQEQIQQIANSIVEFGFLDPIAIDENGEILEGHGRYLASVEILKLKSVPTIQILGLTDAQKVAYRVAHNKLTMNSDFDPDLLKLDLDFLNEMDFNLTLTGFDSEDLEKLNDDLAIAAYDWDSLENTQKPVEVSQPTPQAVVPQNLTPQAQQNYQQPQNYQQSQQTEAPPNTEMFSFIVTVEEKDILFSFLNLDTNNPTPLDLGKALVNICQ